MSNIFVIPADCKYKWIEFDDDLYSMGLIFDIEHWLNTNCIGRWGLSVDANGYFIKFSDTNDLMLFRLTWQ